MSKKSQILEQSPGMPPAEERANKREGTRSQIALYYVLGFLFIICLCFIISGVQSLTVNDTRDLLIAVSGVLSGPLGFIIGYYFKSHTENGG